MKDKEIFDKYGNYDFPTEIKQEGLNSATSQIEAMAIENLKCGNCVHLPLCLAQKGGVNLGLASENDCCYYQPKLPEDSVVLSRKELQELKKYKIDWLNSEKMHLQAEMEETEFELASSNRLFEIVSKENQELKNRVELEKKNTEQLKQFAERLKERMNEGEYMGEKYKLSVFREIDIDETLKKFIKDRVEVEE